MLALCLSIAIVLVDQVTKELARHSLVLRPISVIEGFFDLRFVQNTGAAWGILSGRNHWLVVLSIVMLIGLVRFRKEVLSDSQVHRWCLGFLVGGIIGNLVDRMRLGYVVDFLDFHWHEVYHFPAFNVADMAICTGVGLYLLSQFMVGPAAGPDSSPVEEKVPACPEPTSTRDGS
jgi:signal peptidase II